MIFGDKPLRELTEADVRTPIEMGRQEGATLEYKSELYGENDEGCREFLRDVCMFANCEGGVLIIGIDEVRDTGGQPTGVPDPSAEIGIDLQNPEKQLLAYETRIIDCIDERLPVEMHPVRLASARYVLIIRVPNSLSKPHRVYHKGKVSFSSRRERSRYELDAREIKDLAMRTATQLDRTESVIDAAISDLEGVNQNAPVLSVALLPVFFRNFVVNLKKQSVFDALHTYALPGGGSVTPSHSFEGLTRRGPGDATLTLGHNGLFKLRVSIATSSAGALIMFYAREIDSYIRSFVTGAGALFDAAGLSTPAILGTCLLVNRPLLLSHVPYVATYGENQNANAVRESHKYPSLQITAFGADADPDLRNLCDLIHQTWGISGSPSFDAKGRWKQSS